MRRLGYSMRTTRPAAVKLTEAFLNTHSVAEAVVERAEVQLSPTSIILRGLVSLFKGGLQMFFRATILSEPKPKQNRHKPHRMEWRARQVSCKVRARACRVISPRIHHGSGRRTTERRLF